MRLLLALTLFISFVCISDSRERITIPNDKLTLNEIGIYIGLMGDSRSSLLKLIYPPTLTDDYKLDDVGLVIMHENKVIYYGSLGSCLLTTKDNEYLVTKFKFTMNEKHSYSISLIYLSKDEKTIKIVDWNDLSKIDNSVFLNNRLDKVFMSEQPSYSGYAGCNS